MTIQSFRTHVHPGVPQTYAELLAQDDQEPLDFFRVRGRTDVGPTEIPSAWYLSREIHEREVERIWKRTWQVACRESDVAEVGDTWVYDIAGISIVVVRAARDEIKAYYNSCLHRGVTLRKGAGRVTNLQCPFHGFTWSLNGELRQVPCPEQFPDVKPDELRLPEVRVGRWGGFVFINMDPSAPSLDDFLGTFPAEFANAPYDDRVKVAHVRKILPANWKAAQEAFMEGYHVLTTHPQNTLLGSDRCNQHDAFEHYSRGILARGIPNEYMTRTPSQQEIYDRGMGRWEDDPPLPPLAPDQTARRALAEQARARLTKLIGADAAARLKDAELVDTIYYALFPNFHPFGSFVQPQVTLFRPHGDDHTRCEMDILILWPRVEGRPEPPLPKIKVVPEDEDFEQAPELGFFSAFLNQDISNLNQIMKGLRNNRRGKVIFARQHELQIRHFYSLYTKLMELPLGNEA